ncbi:MAG: 3' terminal RNA ribose 2'-O-methyltransferase Hen1 [Planctomycetes bacterium]|nr:3' terminal RNA ribose 2'-O-methyltransferase Hen1 [Planctomycetota bacterium]
MLLSITTRHRPATDLGHLLHKHPDRLQTFSLTTGCAHVFYPVATPEVCTATLLLDVDAVELVRRPGRPGRAEGVLGQYVNDRPYVASSFLSVAIARVYGSALAGRSEDRPELAATRVPLEATLSVLPCRGGEAFLRRLFEPLGYEVVAQPHLLDEAFPDWGKSRYFTTTLRATVRLSELLGHLYVLVPVLDDDKHYYVGEDEVEKLLRHGEAWLASHPERDRIVERYLLHRRKLAREALARLLDDEADDPDERAGARAAEEETIEAALTLADARIETVARMISESGARRVLDLGCGEGKLLKALLAIRSLDEIVGLDVSSRSLEIAAKRLALDRLPERQARRIRLFHGSLLYRDSRRSRRGRDSARSPNRSPPGGTPTPPGRSGGVATRTPRAGRCDPGPQPEQLGRTDRPSIYCA